jgi:uncharacterized protein DUF4154
MALLVRLTRLVGMLLVLGAMLPVAAHADESLQLREQEIKAGLLYNFLKYVEWPPIDATHATAPVTVCVFGDDPFNGYLQPMIGRTVNRRKIAVRSIRDFPEAAACDLLFINTAEKDRWPQLQKFLTGKTILTVGDFNRFADTGGMIEFGRKDDHINVSLNIDAVTAARLRVEDRLLKLVTVTHSQEEGR